jgi:hypothetical protein
MNVGLVVSFASEEPSTLVSAKLTSFSFYAKFKKCDSQESSYSFVLLFFNMIVHECKFSSNYQKLAIYG